MQRDVYYDNLRFVLIAFVVVGHFALAYLHGASSKPVSIFKDWIWVFHMPAFLFVSGMFAKGLYKPDRGLRVDAICFYLVMYLLFSCVIQAVMMTYSNAEFDLFHIYRIPWYFLALAMLGATLPIAANVRGGAKVVVPVAVLFAIIADSNDGFGSFLSLGRIVNFAPFYLAGYFMTTEDFKHIVQKIQAKGLYIVLDIAFLVAVFAALWFMPPVYSEAVFKLSMAYTPYSGFAELPLPEVVVLRSLWFVLAAAMLVAVSALVPMRRVFFSEMGQRTLQVYLLHPLVYLPMTGFQVIPRYVAPYVPCAGLASILFGFALTFLLAWPEFPARWLKRFQRSFRFVSKVGKDK